MSNSSYLSSHYLKRSVRAVSVQQTMVTFFSFLIARKIVDIEVVSGKDVPQIQLSILTFRYCRLSKQTNVKRMHFAVGPSSDLFLFGYKLQQTRLVKT